MIIKTDPFFHVVIDNFFPEEVAHQLSNDFLDYDDSKWYCFDNPIENKKICNNWNIFPKTTYTEITRLLSNKFVEELKKITGIDPIYPDIGLLGSGWHMHGRGGKLNVHRDYVIHPKIKLSRKLNLIVYLTPNWNPEWGGALEIWSHNSETDKPKECVSKIDCLFNRAIIFDTAQNSWHGLPNALTCPDNVYRKSIALYYLTDITGNEEQRFRAQFVPSKDQINDKSIEEFCEQRSKLY
jgi:hypothetical protein